MKKVWEQNTCTSEIHFSNSLIIHDAKTRKISTVEDVWKSEEKVTKTRPNLG